MCISLGQGTHHSVHLPAHLWANYSAGTHGSHNAHQNWRKLFVVPIGHKQQTPNKSSNAKTASTRTGDAPFVALPGLLFGSLVLLVHTAAGIQIKADDNSLAVFAGHKKNTTKKGCKAKTALGKAGRQVVWRIARPNVKVLHTVTYPVS